MSSKFKQFVKFQSMDWFAKTHRSICDGKFEQVWVRGIVSMSRCAKCGSVAYLTQVSIRPTLTSAPKNRPKQVAAMSTIPTMEGYIHRHKIGLEPVEYRSDKETFKFSNHCIDCGQWFRSTKKEDLCSSCSNTGNIESGLDYDKFYHDSIEFWQGGQKHEVGTEGDLPAKPSYTKPKPSIQVMLLHIHGWLFEGINQREMLHRLSEWWGANSKSDEMYINSMLVRGQNTMPAGWSPA